MNDIFLLLGDYLKGKSIYPAFRRILNLLLNISIASFIYEKFYGKYTWLNYNDYKGILDFFIKGNFFIPFSIFVIVFSITQFLSISVFSIINHIKYIKLTKAILQYQFNKEEIDERLEEIEEASKKISPINLTIDTMLNVYHQLKNNISTQEFNEIEKGIRVLKQNLEDNFSLVFRMTIAITIYFISLSQFGWLLYLIAILVLAGGMFVLFISYRFLDIIPTLVRKFNHLAEQYLKEYLDNKDK